jgi:hypothetical protein
MIDPASTGRTGRFRIGPAIGAAILAFVIGIALMAWAMRNPPRWLDEPTTPQAAPSAQPTAIPVVVDLATLEPRQAALAAQLTALETRAAALNADTSTAAGRAGQASAILLAFAARRAIDRGVGLGYLEEQLRARFGPTMSAETEMVLRASHTPVTLEDLRESLEAAAPTLLTSESDWWAGVGSELRNLIVVHRVGTPSPLPADRLARARRMLEVGNVEGALGEVNRLPGAAQSTNWTDAARRYVVTRHALDKLEAAAITGAIAPAPIPATPPPAPEPTPAG